jgi:hypothetical protein
MSKEILSAKDYNKDRSTHAIIPLEKAVYCQNCNMITDSVGEICISCKSVGGLLLVERLIPPVESEITKHVEGWEVKK